MNKYIYSAKNNAFYPSELKLAYELAGTWPSDGAFVSNAVFNEFSSAAPDGFTRGVGTDGLPFWVKIPPSTKEELISIANYEKSNFLTLAHQYISVWQTQLILGIISDSDKTKLTEWVMYVQAIQAIDTNTVPDIEWPEKPM